MSKRIDFTESEIEDLKYFIGKRVDSLKWVLENKRVETKKKIWMHNSIDKLQALYKKVSL